MDEYDVQREQAAYRFRAQLADLVVQQPQLVQQRRRLTMLVEGYLLAGVPLSLMLDTLGWSTSTWLRGKREARDGGAGSGGVWSARGCAAVTPEQALRCASAFGNRGLQSGAHV